MRTPYWQDTTKWRLGTCCMFDSKPLDDMNMGTTTLTHAKKNPDKALLKAIYNSTKLVEVMRFLSLQPPELRYWRISSEIFPCYTAPEILPHYDSIRDELKQILTVAGETAKTYKIRLSSHPAQFTVMASVNKEVVKRSIEDIEYHALIFEMMGIEPEHGIVNVHLQGVYDGTHEQGIKRFATNFKHLNDYSKRILTVEHEDKPNGYDLPHVIKLANLTGCRVMVDTHHYSCYRRDLNQTLDACNPMFKDAIQTWGRVRPAIHTSQSGNPRRLLEHSDMFHDRKAIDRVIPLLEHADIECEVKAKWTAVNDLYNYIQGEKP